MLQVFGPGTLANVIFLVTVAVFFFNEDERRRARKREPFLTCGLKFA